MATVGTENVMVLTGAFQMMHPYALIKYDTAREEPVRNPRGFCVEVPRGESGFLHNVGLASPRNTWGLSAGETGLLVGKIRTNNPFDGYAKNKQQTEKKKLSDVFVKGDVYFNSGDLLKMDQDGYVYFQDRVGDTFRFVDETNS